MLQELQTYGLSEREAQTYIACLKVGKATANRIVELLNLPRSTTYDVLERLKAAGLVTTIILDNKTHYIASDPDTLFTILEEKKNAIKEVLPQLNAIHNQVEERPAAEVFQGKVAIIKLLDEILDNAKNLKVIGSQGNALEKIGYHPEKFRLKRLENNIKIKQILEVSAEAKQVTEDDHTQVRHLSSLAPSKEAIFIFDEYVYHLIFQYEISGIRIRSKDHAQTMELFFDELWKHAL